MKEKQTQVCQELVRAPRCHGHVTEGGLNVGNSRNKQELITDRTEHLDPVTWLSSELTACCSAAEIDGGKRKQQQHLCASSFFFHLQLRESFNPFSAVIVTVVEHYREHMASEFH